MAPPARKRVKLEEATSVWSSQNSHRRVVVQIAEDRNETKLIDRHDGDDEDDKSRAARLLQQAEERRAAVNHHQGVASSNGMIIVDLTPRGIRTATANLARMWQTNERQRAEYAPDQPERYMDSEVLLFEHIRSLKAIATGSVSQLYPLLVKNQKEDEDDDDDDNNDNDSSSLLSILTQLLGHDNTDIVTSVIAVLLEWLDVSLLLVTEDETERDQSTIEPAMVQLAAQMLQPGGAVEWLVDLLPRLAHTDHNHKDKDNDNDDDVHGGDDDDVGKGAEDILSLLENLLEIDLQVQQYQQLSRQSNDGRLSWIVS